MWDPKRTEYGPVINISLQADAPADAWAEPTLSFFGHDRFIKQFELCVYPAAEKSDEGIDIQAYEEFEYEDSSFKKRIHKDTVYFVLTVSREQFKNYAYLLTNGLVDSISFRVSHVPGFYAPWSPTVHGDHIKILTPDIKNLADKELAGDIDPPHLAAPNEYTTSLRRRTSLQSSAHHEEDTDAGADLTLEGSDTLEFQSASEKAHAELQKVLASINTKIAWIGVLVIGLVVTCH
jgi:hypothetical protein